MKKSKKKWIVPVVVVVVLGVIAFLAVPKLLPQEPVSTRITTYNVETVTTGNVSTTISGSGNLTPVTLETLTTSYSGEVKKVNYKVGDAVEEDDVIATVYNDNSGTKKITAPCDGIVIELSVEVGDEVSRGAEIVKVMGKDGYTLSMNVDELNISSIEIGQSVEIEIDAKDGEYTGKVNYISYNGTTSGSSTNYAIKAKLDYIEGVYPGMSASGEIVIEDSGEGLLVPVDAVHTSGDSKYVYLAPSDAIAGQSYEEDAMDVSTLEKIEVTTGMSDGSFILVTSEELSEGSLIIIEKVTSTQTSSESDSDEQSMPGMNFGGMDFGNMDFGNMDFSNMPGNMPSGGNMPSRPGGGSGMPGN